MSPCGGGRTSLGNKGSHEAHPEQPSKHGYLRLKEYFWSRKFQIQDLPLHGFMGKQNQRQVDLELDQLPQ